MSLELSERVLDGYAVVELHGELDLSSASDLRERLLDIVSQQTASLILDLSGLRFMDSTGISVLMATERRANLLGGSLSLVNPQKVVARVLQVTSLDKHFAIFPTVADATAARGPAGSLGATNPEAGPPVGAA